jgi:hypothetical protein
MTDFSDVGTQLPVDLVPGPRAGCALEFRYGLTVSEPEAELIDFLATEEEATFARATAEDVAAYRESLEQDAQHEALGARAIEAARVAISTIPEAYVNPFVRWAAKEAAELALGLRHPHIITEEGES